MFPCGRGAFRPDAPIVARPGLSLGGIGRAHAVVFSGVCSEPAAKSPGSASGEAAAPSEEVEAQPAPAAPVLVGGEPAIWISPELVRILPSFAPNESAERIYKIIRDRSIQDLKMSIVEAGGSSELRIGQRLVMSVTKADAAVSVGLAREVGREYGKDMEAADPERTAAIQPATLMRSSVYALISTIALAAMLWLIGNFTTAPKPSPEISLAGFPARPKGAAGYR